MEQTATSSSSYHHSNKGSSNNNKSKRLLRNNFANAKAQCLGKRDKSSAGRIDPHAVEICAVINDHYSSAYYTTSSCAGRCFLYRGQGYKATLQFQRFRVSHDCIKDPERYFNLETLDDDPTGGGDPVRSIGQFEHAEKVKEMKRIMQQGEESSSSTTATTTAAEPLETEQEVVEEPESNDDDDENTKGPIDKSIWLRFEPFILHVACRSLAAASALMTAARPSFKNVGLTTWKKGNDDSSSSSSSSSSSARFLVAVWGDEGLEMPLTLPDGTPLMPLSSSSISISQWLASLVNERHERNWSKIDRFVQAVREMPAVVDDMDDDCDDDQEETDGKYSEWFSTDAAPTGNGEMAQQHKAAGGVRVPRSFDVVGDVAVVHSLANTTDPEQRRAIGEAIMQKNKAIKVVVLRESTLNGTERSPGQQGFARIAGASRSPLITSHNEHGIRCVVDLEQTFFSPRMGPERLRICQQVARGEHVLVLFSGVGMDAMQIAGRTEASSVVAVELNEVAVKCARLSHRMLANNKAVKCVGAAERLEIIHGDVLGVVPTLPRDHFDRIVAPRPKEGALDGDLGNGESGLGFLQVMLPVLKQDGGECHWYEFVADHEFPTCTRSSELLTRACDEHGLSMEVIHVANAGSVAMRQLRVCIDFRVFRRA